ncbi:MAG: uracil-DNA glycosylase [Clostridia bacterium]
MVFKTNNNWDSLLQNEINKPYFKKLDLFIEQEYLNFEIFPPKKDIFKALTLTDFNDVNVVILGQDPYHKKGVANGLCFSVNKEMPIPPSLKNIYKEIENDVHTHHLNGDLTYLANQGVLLLNTVLTVRNKVAGSHQNVGWEIFTNEIISLLNSKKSPIVFLLWGNFAISKKELITNPIHSILTAAHPSPLSAYRGFFGCKHFSKTNILLKSASKDCIKW